MSDDPNVVANTTDASGGQAGGSHSSNLANGTANDGDATTGGHHSSGSTIKNNDPSDLIDKTNNENEGDETMEDAQTTTETTDGPVTSDELWTKGDIALVSSDGVRFRVDSHHVYWASPALCSRFKRLPKSAGPEITLTNTVHETSPILRHFLCLVTKGDIDSVPTDDLYLLVHFLKAHECKVLLKWVLCMIRENQRAGKIEPLTTFVVGAISLDRETLRHALNAFESTWPNINKEGDGYDVGATEGSPVFDPFQWPLALWHTVPSLVTFALVNAWRKMRAKPGLADLFVVYLEKEVKLGDVSVDTEDDDSGSGSDDSTSDSDDDDDGENEDESTSCVSDDDFELISADGIRFRINSFDLFSHSGVFRDGRTLSNSGMSVTFTDEDIERGSVLRAFMQLIRTGGVAGCKNDASVRRVGSLILFLRKFECPVDLSVLLMYLREGVRDDDWDPSIVFNAGIVADDSKTWNAALQIRTWTWTDNKGSLWNPYCCTRSFWTILPVPCLWALGRAWNKVGNSDAHPAEFTKWYNVAMGRSDSGAANAKKSTS